jgi:hypothetical protein
MNSFPFLLVATFPLSVFAAEPAAPKPQDTEVWAPEPPVVTAPPAAPPSDASVLFDGTNFDQWESTKEGAVAWKLVDGAMEIVPKTSGIRTKKSWGDIQLHLEFQSPAVVEGKGQGRGNSGVFLMGQYELQVLDSYENKTYVNGQAASIYKQFAPLVNASRPPGEWQTYDVVFIAPRFNGDGTVASPARITVFHNGVLVHHDRALNGPTDYIHKLPYKPHPPKLPLELQHHGDAVRFRNIWVRELSLPPPA